jgi:hypothetical protein
MLAARAHGPYAWDWSSSLGRITPGGGVPVQGNLGGTDQLLGQLKSTVPPENLASSKLSSPRAKLTSPPENLAERKSTVPPENSAS